jgi:hypothetical protein
LVVEVVVVQTITQVHQLLVVLVEVDVEVF